MHSWTSPHTTYNLICRNRLRVSLLQQVMKSDICALSAIDTRCSTTQMRFPYHRKID